MKKRLCNDYQNFICVCVHLWEYRFERHLGGDFASPSMEPMVTRLAQGVRARTSENLSPDPPPRTPPFFSAVCVSLSSSSGTLTFSFFLGKASCRCPARLMVSRVCCSWVGAAGACAVPFGGPTLLPLGGGVCEALCWLGWGLCSSPLTSGRRD